MRRLPRSPGLALVQRYARRNQSGSARCRVAGRASHLESSGARLVDRLDAESNPARANGHFSIITTTYESFPIAQQLLADFIARDSILSSIVGHYYKAVVKNTTVASDKTELIQALHHHQFEVVDHQRLQIPLTINSIDELLLFGIEGSWFINSLSVKILPRNFLLQRIKGVFSKIFTFPYQDTHIIDIILAKK